MPYDPNRHHRRSIRLPGYDYASNGSYFVTIHTQGNTCPFGSIQNDSLILNSVGNMVDSLWNTMPDRFPSVVLDVYVVMPNHFHALLALHASTTPAVKLSAVIGAFKSLTTTAYIAGIAQYGWQPFNKRLWHRNYYEHIVRSEFDYARIRHYITENPQRWIASRSTRLKEHPAPFMA